MRRLALLLAVAALACVDIETPEAIVFSFVQPELFGDGGTLTDAWADIDGDGHLIEYQPLVRDFVVEIAGEEIAQRFDTTSIKESEN